MTDQIAVPTGTLLAVRRLLWDIGATDTTQHDQKVECFHWGAVLDHLAGMPPWPTEGEGVAKCIAFYESVRANVDATIEGLKRSEESEG
jgi:hypothetical protein